MKKYILILSVFAISCKYIGLHTEQEVRDGFCGNRQLVTYVWKDNEIIRSWYDPIESMTPELIQLRQRQADSVVAMLKTLK